VPPALFPPSLGCLVAVLGYLALTGALFVASRNILFIVLALPGLFALGYRARQRLRARLILADVQRTYGPSGVRCLIIYSNSPVWQDHIRTQWFPRLGAIAETLNWSERAAWPDALAPRVFRHFCFQARNFNPAIIVFRGLQQPLVFRFFYAFHEAKDGRPQYLSSLETQAFEALGLRAAA
jgi:hypothetical protein